MYPPTGDAAPNDSDADRPVSREFISSRSGAGVGDRAFSTSLILSTAVPIGVV